MVRDLDMPSILYLPICFTGLYVKEAVSRLSQFIREAPALGQTNLRVITGKGLHSEGEPQILPAVEESLRK